MKTFMITLIVTALLIVFLEIFLRLTGLGTAWNMDSFGRRKSIVDKRSVSSKTIVAAGDSLTFGCRILEQDSYPSQLEMKLNDEGNRWSVINSGISGHTSVQLNERLDRDVLAYHPRIVIIWVGTNDGMLKPKEDPNVFGERPYDHPPILAKSVLLTTLDSIHTVMNKTRSLNRPKSDFQNLVPRVDESRFEKNLKQIIYKVKADGISKIILIGIPMIPDSFSDYAELLQLQRRIHKKYNDIIYQIAVDLNIPFIDTQSILNESCFLPDGLHLTKKGYEVISIRVHEAIYNYSM